jgi:hypothetical protein
VKLQGQVTANGEKFFNSNVTRVMNIVGIKPLQVAIRA